MLFRSGFTVFGRVLRGTNVLARFNDVSTNSGLYRLDLDQRNGPLSRIPVLSRQASSEDLIYLDISLLQVQVTQEPNGTQAISWRSVSNLLNRVEFTTEFPPVWQDLIQTNGTGSEIRVLDPQPPPNHRFYRVRVDY